MRADRTAIAANPARPAAAADGWKIAGLTVAVAALLLAVNAPRLLHTELHEHADLAANSLAVRQAKVFRELHGQYSRWGFRHPGPGWFYLFAAGEWLFHDRLKLVPTPVNGQLLVLLVVQAGFFAAAVGTAARWVRGAVFVPLVLLLAVAHFGAAGIGGGDTAFLSNWSPHFMVLPFLCLVVAAASVGAGRGRDLPLLALAGGALLHGHVAQPLFVVPLGAVAYGGLALTTHRGRGESPWRTFPRAHLFVLMLAALCALPVVLDACRGRESNLAAILQHLHSHRDDQRHPWNQALFYLLRFGAYKPSLGEEVFRGGASSATIRRFVFGHTGMYALWLCALLLPAAAFALRLAVTRRRKRLAPSVLVSGSETVMTATRWRYLGWLAGMITLAAGLTLYWGCIQDGDLWYFNAWFDYGLYFALALLAAGAAADLAETLLTKGIRRVVAVGLLLATAGLFAGWVDRFRRHDMEGPHFRAMATSVVEALQTDGGEGSKTRRFLSFTHDGWGAAAAAALEAERRGYRIWVTPNWAIMFGERNASADPLVAADGGSGNAPVVWRFLRMKDDPDNAGRRPLADAYGIRLGAPALDPAAAPRLSFHGPPDGSPASFTPYALYGWSQPEPGGVDAWSELPTGVLAFAAVPVPAGAAGVEMTADLFPALTPGWRDHQRLELEFNGTVLGRWEFRDGQPAQQPQLRVVIPAALWNKGLGPTVESRLVWRFPDALSPAAMGHGADARQIAFGFREVVFRVLPASSPEGEDSHP